MTGKFDDSIHQRLVEGMFPIQWIPVKDLSVVWIESQRPLRQIKVDEMREEGLDRAAFGFIVVTLPDGAGVYHIVDGQHRRKLVQDIWGDDEAVPCLVIPQNSPRAAADVWLRINSKHVKPSILSNFLVSVTAGRVPETECNDLVERLRYSVTWSSVDGTISCVNKMLYIRRRFGLDVLEEALLVSQDIWGMERDAVHGEIVLGLAGFVNRYRGLFDRARMADRMSKKFTPGRLLGAARQAREFRGGTIADNIGKILHMTYNAGLRSKGLLDEWGHGTSGQPPTT